MLNQLALLLVTIKSLTVLSIPIIQMQYQEDEKNHLDIHWIGVSIIYELMT